MKKIMYLFIATVLFGACCNQTNKKSTSDSNEEKCTTISVENFLEKATELVDKQVTVKGTVDHVCKRSGKRIKIFSADPEKQIHAIAGEAIGNFPEDLEGTEICLTGIVKAHKMSSEDIDKYENRVKEAMKEDSETGDVECKDKDKEATEAEAEDHHHETDYEAILAKIAKWKEDLTNSEDGMVVVSYYLNEASYKSCEGKCAKKCNEEKDSKCNKSENK